MRRAIATVAVLAIAGCDDVRAPITIVVETDRARAAEERTALRALREGVQGDRKEVEAARAQLDIARQKLAEVTRSAVAAGATPQQRAERDQLAQHVVALEIAARANVGAALTARELDEALAAHEARVAARIAAEVDRALAGAAPAPPRLSATPQAAGQPAQGSERGDVARLLEQARAALAAKGLQVADLDGGTAAVERIDGALAHGDVAGAQAVAQALSADAAAAVVDTRLVRRKYDRINQRAKREAAGSPRHARAVAGLRQAADALSNGDVQAANRALNELGRDLR